MSRLIRRPTRSPADAAVTLRPLRHLQRRRLPEEHGRAGRRPDCGRPGLRGPEECGQYDECGDYVDAFGNNVIVIECTGNGRRTACSQYGGTLSIVQRDVDVSVPGDSGYVRKTC